MRNSKFWPSQESFWKKFSCLPQTFQSEIDMMEDDEMNLRSKISKLLSAFTCWDFVNMRLGEKKLLSEFRNVIQHFLEVEDVVVTTKDEL